MTDVESGARDLVIQKASRGVQTWFARGIVLRVISLATNFALVGLVSPSLFGFITVVRALNAGTYFLTDLGLESAVVRRRQAPTTGELGAVVGLRVILLTALLAIAAVWPAARTGFGTLDQSSGLWFLGLLAVTVITPSQFACKVTLERELEYGRLAFLEITVVLVENVGLVIAALLGRIHEGVFVVFMASYCYSTLLVYYWAGPPPISFRWSELRHLAGDAAGFSAATALQMARQVVTPLLIAHLFGLSIAGLWGFATRASQTIQLAYESFSRIGLAAAGRLADDLAGLKVLATSAVTGAAALVLPGAAALLIALPVVGELWPEWIGAVPIAALQLAGLATAGMLAAVLEPIAAVRRGSKIVALEQLASLAAAWAVLALLWTVDAPLHVGWAGVAASVAAGLVVTLALRREISLPWRGLARPLLLAAFIISCGWIMTRVTHSAIAGAIVAALGAAAATVPELLKTRRSAVPSAASSGALA